jgi:hypothetical protein
MRRECGDLNYPIWLLGDSEPKNWQDKLDTPFDSKHPIRHNIWTSVFDIVQDEVYRQLRQRIDTSMLYIRNAIGDPDNKPPSNREEWNADVTSEVENYKILLERHKPIIIFSFGSFSYEFARRATNLNPNKPYRFWDTKELGKEFRSNIGNFKVSKTNIIPLLHRSIAGGKFLESHDYFCGNKKSNYFDYVGKEIANKIISNAAVLNKIWI